MTLLELLEPRIIVENLYPNCPFQALEIMCNPSTQQTEWANTYPYIFRWLAWYEERKESDMPGYLKEGGNVYKNEKDFTYRPTGITLINKRCVNFLHLQPATIEEYQNQKQ